MAVAFPTSRLPGSPAVWLDLLEAIYQAGSEDETDELEFKSECDLTNGQKVGKMIARTILAMANRDPDVALRTYDGSGLIVVGLEPGRVPGVTPIDKTRLGSLVGSFVGSGEGAPGWRPEYWEFRGTTVLVVEVYRPRWGDPMFLLRKALPELRVDQDAVFTRRNTASERANPSEMQMLSRRAQAMPDVQTLPFVVLPDVVTIDGYLVDEKKIAAFVEKERAGLLGYVDDFHRSQRPKIGGGFSGIAGAAVFSSTGDRAGDDRTEQQYRDEVDRYVTQLLCELPEVLRTVASTQIGPARTLIRNASQRYFERVEVAIELPEGVDAVESYGGGFPNLSLLLPEPPRVWKPPRHSQMLSFPSQRSIHRQVQLIVNSVTARDPRFSIDRDGRHVRLLLDELRPDQTVPLDEEMVLIVTPEHDGPVTLHWRATAARVDGAASGELIFERSGAYIDVVKNLLRALEEE